MKIYNVISGSLDAKIAEENQEKAAIKILRRFFSEDLGEITMVTSFGSEPTYFSTDSLLASLYG